MALQDISPPCPLSDVLQEHPRKACLRTGTVLIKVGKDEFLIHRGLLTHYSTYFAAALREGFREAEEGIVSLDEDRADVFEAVHYWLYTGVLPSPASVKAWISDITTIALEKGVIDLLSRMWLFGEMRGMPVMQDAVASKLVTFSTPPPPGVVVFAYEWTLKSSPLRKLLVDSFASQGYPGPLSLLKASHKAWPKGFVGDANLAIPYPRPGMMTVKPSAGLKHASRCKYHVHGYGFGDRAMLQERIGRERTGQEKVLAPMLSLSVACKTVR